MEALVLVKEVGAYSERQYQKQDGSTEYFKSRGVVMKHGGEATGNTARGRTRTVRHDMRTHSISLTFKHFRTNVYISERY